MKRAAGSCTSRWGTTWSSGARVVRATAGVAPTTAAVERALAQGRWGVGALRPGGGPRNLEAAQTRR
jgi:hypothetical protein